LYQLAGNQFRNDLLIHDNIITELPTMVSTNKVTTIFQGWLSEIDLTQVTQFNNG
jgi:hypothetical protein